MSFFSGYRFFVYFTVLMIPAVVLGMRGKSLKLYRNLLTVFFIVMVYQETPKQFLNLILYGAGACYLVKIYLYLRIRYGRNEIIYGHAVFLALFPLVLSKAGGMYGKNIFGFLGISYICFRVLQVVIEIYDGVIDEIKIPDFLAFLLYFPVLSSGPIDRSRRFLADHDTVYTREEYAGLLRAGLYKLLVGMFYKIVCSACFYKLLTQVFAGRYRPVYLAGYAYVYGLYMFFDFAGYSFMAVGASYLLGIKMPDNFNKPFISVDMKEFWNRWHITLSSWLRDFVFTRFMVNAARKKWFKDRLGRAAAGLMFNMVLMGMWHGLESHYLAYGVYHGVLLSVTEIWQERSHFYQINKEKAWYRAISWFVTLNLVMFGFLIFSGHVQEVWEVFIRKL